MTRVNIFKLCAPLLFLWALLPQLGLAQTSDKSGAAENLPSAPQPQFTPNPSRIVPPPQAQMALVASFQTGDGSQTNSSVDPKTAQAGQAPITVRLTRTQAEQLALKNNPRISVGRLLALAQHQIYRETRSAELPNFNGTITAVDANEGSRIGAGALNAPRLLEHAGGGVTLSQLITDFGRTINLVSSSKLMEKAQNASALATTEDIVLATDQAFYNALQAQALLKVAQQTVITRGSVQHQIDELTKSKLKSTLDLSFADVTLSQAKLLQLDAQNNVDSTIAALTAVLGFDKQVGYELTEENAQPPSPPPDVDVLINTAMQQRPDLQAFTYDQQAAEKFRRAQRDQLFPTISALGMMGGTPVRPDCFGGCFPNYFTSSWYGAVGVNMSVPIFNGFLVQRAGVRSKIPGPSRNREHPRSSRPGSARRPHCMAIGEYGISARRRGCRARQRSRLKFDSRSGSLSPWPGLDRRTESGAVAANRCGHRLCQRSIPVSAGSLNLELRDWSAALNLCHTEISCGT